jgi:hypothetical protein
VQDNHEPLGGQRQGGISTPSRSPYVIIFTGEAGKTHGYRDFWDDQGVFHYYGEGQKGDMMLTGGNRAILRHVEDGKRLLLFQMMGKSQPYRYLGEFVCQTCYEKPGTLDTEGALRKALVFCLVPKSSDTSIGQQVADKQNDMELDETVIQKVVAVRKKQELFRRRLIGIEKGCRLTGVRDLRFVRASHIKPWAACDLGMERVDGNNGLLLTPSADHLFDQGWISFEGSGRLLRSSDLPADVVEHLAINLKHDRSVGEFNASQSAYLEYHRNAVFGKKYASTKDPHEALIATLANLV